MVENTGVCPETDAEETDNLPFILGFFPYLLAHAHSLLTRHVTSFAANEKSSRNDFRVMVTLVDNDNLSLGQLAEMMQVKQPTLSRIIENLVTSGLVERRGSKKDRRAVEIRLSPAGKRAVKPLLKQAQSLNDDIVSKLGITDAENLVRILKRIVVMERARDSAAVE